MVQKDDRVIVNFKYQYSNNSNKTCSVDIEHNINDIQSLSTKIKDNIDSFFESKDNIIERCILKLPHDEIDITTIITDCDLFDKMLEKVQESNRGEKLLEILIIYDHNMTQCSEDESSASPISDGEYSSLHTINSAKGMYRNRIISTASQDYIDNKNSDSPDSFENTRTKSILYNNTDTVEYNYVGLVNQAMTCYLNSLLQALYMTPEFRNAVYNWEYKNLDKNSEDKSIPYQLQKLFLNLQMSTKPAVETTSLTTSFGWNYHDAWDQHDIQELCRVMFDALEQTFKNTEQADLISRLYEGKINDYVKCLTCHTEKSREDTFLDIPLPVKPFDANVAYERVTDALEAFVKYETLEGNNQYFCEECNRMSDAQKGLKFTKFPYILTLQLKRFDFDQKSFHRIKLNDRVEFPDVLNLNSFIESKSPEESPTRDEDAGVKGDNSCNTNNFTMEEDCITNDVKSSNSNHLNNPDQDDDEGIDMRTSMLLSSSAYNHNIKKLREEYASSKGPYIYELFSIMIHSGSASGGHYYAYIKDFRNKKWQCFNDQNVTSIDHTDIPKIFGGNTKASLYSGAYRSSTNAYMLMYRQIDPERNVLPLKEEDFPPHIKDLLEKMKRGERDQSYHEEQSNVNQLIAYNIYYRHPANGNVKHINVRVKKNYTLAQVAESAYKIANLDDEIKLDQCRIVTYFVNYDLVNRTYESNTRLDTLFKDQLKFDDLLLDISQSKNFESYPSEPIVTKVFLVNPVKQELVDFPKFIRAYRKQTVREYKQELTKHFDINPDNVQLLCLDLQMKKLEDDFIFELQLPSYLYVCATETCAAESIFYKMSAREYLSNIFTFDLDVSDINKEQCEFLKIPFLTKEKNQENDSSNYHCPIEDIAKLNMSPFNNYKCNNIAKTIDLQETSNSEDSSLSDSDRTLVGDVPEDSDFDCEMDVAEAKNEEIEIKKCIKITDIPNSRYWKVTISAGVTEDELREELQTKLSIPKDYFRILESEKERIGSAKYKTTFRGGLKYYVRLGRTPNYDESKIDIYILEMTSSEPLRKLFTMNLKKNLQFDNAKQQIIAEYKRINNIESNEKYRFMEIFNGELIYSSTDDEKSLKLISEEICIQKLTHSETTFDNESSLVYLKKWNRSEMQLEDFQSIIINNDNFNEQLKNKISLMVNISIEHLQFYPLVVTKRPVTEYIDTYDWRPEINLEDLDLFKTYILFRDSSQKPKKLSDRDTYKIYADKKYFSLERGHMGMLTPMTSSPRREKALKIHVHST